ncbi:Protein takeout [Frankliniella fusca]|uniref:Protein takeout n=1 Tax=Frankliniella fusca TaxID=407009 RepID=A0AAE1HSU2_9NEOP|nr:Protein takeout [Frankliniella fusca]
MFPTLAIVLLLQGFYASLSAAENLPPYIHQCRWSDPKVTECFIHAMMHIRPWLAQGIPEIALPAVEPFRLNELSLSLTTGPNGYRVNLRDIDLYGASNFSVTHFRLSEKGAPFELQIRIPQLRINADYTSSGVLIIIPASGKGSFHAALAGVTAVLRGATSSAPRAGRDYLRVDKLNVDLKIRDVNMGIRRAFNNNAILTEATNLFLRSNGHEVLEAMMPQLRLKIAEVFMGIANKLLAKVPVQYLVRD